jgi:YebC/PmpR family DNA-binding regulatory protein
MSGHSKWATIKHKKAKTDSARGKAFTKIIKEVTTAARIGGGDLNGNPRLRMAVDRAKAENMPADNVKRAILKGTGELEGVLYEELSYEGYGPAGVAIIIDVLTDNKNRTLGEIRNIFDKGGGNLGAEGCVSWGFKRKGVITFEKGKASEDAVTSAAIDAGAEDIDTEGDVIEIITKPEDFEKVRDGLKAAKFEPSSAEITMLPSSTVKVLAEDAQKVLNLVTRLEDHEDVQAVHANFDIPDDVIKALAEKE